MMHWLQECDSTQKKLQSPLPQPSKCACVSFFSQILVLINSMLRLYQDVFDLLVDNNKNLRLMTNLLIFTNILAKGPWSGGGCDRIFSTWSLRPPL